MYKLWFLRVIDIEFFDQFFTGYSDKWHQSEVKITCSRCDVEINAYIVTGFCSRRGTLIARSANLIACNQEEDVDLSFGRKSSSKEQQPSLFGSSLGRKPEFLQREMDSICCGRRIRAAEKKEILYQCYRLPPKLPSFFLFLNEQSVPTIPKAMEFIWRWKIFLQWN